MRTWSGAPSGGKQLDSRRKRALSPPNEKLLMHPGEGSSIPSHNLRVDSDDRSSADGCGRGVLPDMRECSFNDLHDVLSCQEINDLPISEIERRARPIEDKHEDVSTWQFRSFGGFLGPPPERLLEVIDSDWRMVHGQLNTSHHCLAFYLRELIALATAGRRRGPHAAVACTLRVRRACFSPGGNDQCDHHESDDDIFTNFTVARRDFMSAQLSVFSNVAHSNTEASLDDLMQWSCDHVIECDADRSHSILLAGDDVCGVISYIDRFCFFEGGRGRNQYRVEPALLVAMLTNSFTSPVLRDTITAQVVSWEEQLQELHDAEYPSEEERTYMINESLRARTLRRDIKMWKMWLTNH